MVSPSLAVELLWLLTSIDSPSRPQGKPRLYLST